jgi:hypothetical protein
VLTFLAVYVTVLSVLLMEVAPLVVRVEELTSSSSEDVELVCLTQQLEIGVGEVLELSLVQAWYFQDSDEGSELVEEWTYVDVINNHDH